MLGKISAVLLLVFLNNVPENSGGSSSSECDMFSPRPVPYATPSPINIISGKAIKVNVRSSLVLQNSLTLPLKVINTGYALETHAFPYEYKHIVTFGGVLGSGRNYSFYKSVFYVSDNPNISSYTQIDGKGTQFALSLIYLNQEYSSFDECLEHHDGMAIINFRLDFSPLDNPLLTEIEPILRSLNEPGANVTITGLLAYGWYNKISQISEYYANRGSYMDLKTKKQHPCAIMLETANSVEVLSRSQFEIFVNMKNTNGTNLINAQPIHESGERPICKAAGIEATVSK